MLKGVIIQQDIDLAKAEYKQTTYGSNVCQCCVLFQAAKRLGLPVDGVTSDKVYMKNRQHYTIYEGTWITGTINRQWQTTLGKEFALDGPYQD